MDEKLVKQCHDKGMKIIPWTVNDAKADKETEEDGSGWDHY